LKMAQVVHVGAVLSYIELDMKLFGKIVNVQLTIIFDKRIIPRLVDLQNFGV